MTGRAGPARCRQPDTRRQGPLEHGANLITTLAAGLGLAMALGFLAARLKLPPLVGYLLAGILIGPATPGFVADVALSQQLAEIGVILLMFGVGLHFSLNDLLSVRNIALPGAIVQIAVATALGVAVSQLWGWDLASGLVFGVALSTASTVVLLRALETRGLLDSVNGRIAVGWLVVEDLAMVLVLVILPALADTAGPRSLFVTQQTAGRGLLEALGVTLGQVMLFIVIMLVLGRRVFPWLLWQVASTGSRELFSLCVTAGAVGIAYAAARFFGVSFALGAFLAGMVLRESTLSFRAAEESLPLRDAFAVLFFVSVGMLFDPAALLNEPLRLILVLGIIMFGKSIAAFAIVLSFRYPLNTALTVSASLAQIGEFSFILANLGVALNVLPTEGRSLILAASLISIALNPAVFHAIEPIQAWIRRRSGLARMLERSTDPLAELPIAVSPERLSGHVVLVGYGRVGRRVGEALQERGITFVVAEQNRELVERLRERGILAVSGDATDPATVIQAHIARARMLIIATPDPFQARQILEISRRLNPLIESVVRTHSDEEAELLYKEKAGKVFMGEHELALGIIRHVVERLTAAEERVHGHRTVH